MKWLKETKYLAMIVSESESEFVCGTQEDQKHIHTELNLHTNKNMTMQMFHSNLN